MQQPNSNPFVPDKELALTQFKKYFLNRMDWVAGLMKWQRPQPLVGNDDRNAYLDRLLLSHLLGDQGEKAVAVYQKKRGGKTTWFNEKNYYRIGSYCPAPPDNLTKWTCIDFDGGSEHASSLKTPLTAALECQAICNSVGIPSYLEKSGGGKGFHIWIFFVEPIPAAVARRFGFLIAPQGYETNDGKLADAKRNQGIEVFAKQERLSKKGYGNLVWLPFWYKAPKGANIFYEEVVNQPGAITPVLYKSFDTVTLEAVESGIESLQESYRVSIPAGVDPETNPTGKPGSASNSTQAPATPATSASDKELWRAWRDKALAALDVETFYADILTGSISGQGWFEARAHDSPTGDRTPSAGVATGSGDAERGTYHNFRSSETYSVFDYCVETGQAADNKAALKLIAKITGVALPEVSRKNAPATSTGKKKKATGSASNSDKGSDKKKRKPRRPQIQINARDLDEIVRDVWQAIHGANKKPHLFSRGSDLVKLSDGKTGKFIQELNLTKTHGIITRWASFIRVSENSVVNQIPPKDIAGDILNFPDVKNLPRLDTVISSPVFNRQGKLITEPGYHASISAWHEPASTLNDLSIPDNPTAGDVEAAKSLLFDDLLVNFNFVSEADRSHYLGALLTPFIRPMFSGSIPLHLVEAPTPGTGKSLLCNLLSMIIKESPAEAKALSRSEDEIRKTLTAELKQGSSLIVIDNVNERRPVDSPTLASVLTAEIWSDRILGESRVIQVNNQALWLMTSNNPKLSLEITRRTLRVRLDPECDRPWQRKGFKHPNILQWAKSNRRNLVEAVLTLIQYWLRQGAILGKGSIGGFEVWSAIMSGIMHSIGETAYLQNVDELYDNADEESEQWRAFCAVWFDANAEIPQTVQDLVNLAEENQLLGDTIGDRTERSKVTRFGKALFRNKDRQYGDYRISKGGVDNHTHKKTWTVKFLGTGGGYLATGGQEAQSDLFSFDADTDKQDHDKEALPSSQELDQANADQSNQGNIDSAENETLAGESFFNVSDRLQKQSENTEENQDFAKRAKRFKSDDTNVSQENTEENQDFAKRAKLAKRFSQLPIRARADKDSSVTENNTTDPVTSDTPCIYNRGSDVSHVSHVSQDHDNTKEKPESTTFRNVSHVSQDVEIIDESINKTNYKQTTTVSNVSQDTVITDKDGKLLSMEQLFPLDDDQDEDKSK